MTTQASITQHLANAMMVTGSMRSVISPGFLYFYDGPIPSSAEDAIDVTAHKCFKFTLANDGSTSLTFQSTAANGVLRKTTAEDWKGACLHTTSALTFYRWCTGSDDGTGASSGNDRVQGTIGTDATFGFILSALNYTSGDLLDLTDFQIILPQEPAS
ncbi:MAG TPA: hypothetical protein VLE97_01840 [Gaiellaceae bacterium]|nr:hypothetical protein [Gaiellaceae bacterium]